MRTTSVARWVSEAKTPWAWRFGKRCLPKREFWKSGLPRAQNDTRRRRARSDNPKAGFAKSKRRGVQIPLACGLGHRTVVNEVPKGTSFTTVRSFRFAPLLRNQKILTHMSEDFFIILCFSLLLAPIFLRAESATFRVAKAFCAASALFSYFYLLNICVCPK